MKKNKFKAPKNSKGTKKDESKELKNEEETVSSFIPEIQVKSLEEIFPGLRERETRKLEEEIRFFEEKTPENNNFSVYEFRKENKRDEYSLTGDYQSSSSYDLSMEPKKTFGMADEKNLLRPDQRINRNYESDDEMAKKRRNF